MTPPTLTFSPFDEGLLAATRAKWTADAESGLAFPSEVERLLAWAEAHHTPREGEGVAYGIFAKSGKKGPSPALGICEIAITRHSTRSKWVKMLRLHLSPAVDSALQAGEPDLASDVFTQSLIGTVFLQSEHNATTMKVYGRTNEQLTVLKVLVNHLQSQLAKSPENKIKASIEGRFLVITSFN